MNYNIQMFWIFGKSAFYHITVRGLLIIDQTFTLTFLYRFTFNGFRLVKNIYKLITKYGAMCNYNLSIEKPIIPRST